MGINYRSAMHRARRETGWQETKEWNALTQEEKDEKLRQKSINSAKFKLNAQIFITIYITILSLVLLFHAPEFYSGEQWFNTILMIMTSIVCWIIVKKRIDKVKEHGYESLR